MATANDAISRRFDLLRKKQSQEANRAIQQGAESMQRKFASTGNLGSGAAVKSENILRKDVQRQLQEGQQALGVEEAGLRQQQEEIEKQRQFQTGERLGSQQFASEQAGLGRQFQTGERLGSQQFAAEQAGIGRKFQTGERLGSQEFAGAQSALTRKIQEAGLEEQIRSTKASEGLAGQQFEEAKRQFGISSAQQKELADANIAFQKLVFEKEFGIEEKIATKNLKAQAQEMGWIIKDENLDYKTRGFANLPINTKPKEKTLVEQERERQKEKRNRGR